MFVRMWMTAEVVTVNAETPILEARTLMKQHSIRRLPVLKHGRLVGIVTQGDIQEASPSDATSLSVWELNYLLAKTRVSDIMTPRANLSTIGPDDPVEKAALLMRERKISGLPVLEEDELVGIITESDIFDILLHVMGVRMQGTRLTLALCDAPQMLVKVLDVCREQGVKVLSIVTCDECRRALPQVQDKSVVVVRVEGYDFKGIVRALKASGIEVLDARN